MLELWIRHETRSSERRCPLSPADAGTLVRRGARITVEESPQRIYPLADYAAQGCETAPAGAWVDAPPDAVVLGLKELPDEPARLRHRHVFFGHAYKGQPGARQLLERFREGGGTLLDLEQLADEAGRRHAAFGYWAGFVGAALGVLQQHGDLTAPLQPTTSADLVEKLRRYRDRPSGDALVIGALGRSGRGAVAALAEAGVSTTRWDVAETRHLDRAALLRHELLVNAVLTGAGTEPLLRRTDLADPGCRLRCVVDVSCDPGSPYNALPIYDAVTTWEAPATAAGPVAVIAIDNLPSLLPKDATDSFSADLLPHLMDLDGLGGSWGRCAAAYRAAVEGLPTSEVP
ncbi:saccharopine dehydrogenase [Couchioplanes caeruleus]|uniref:Saccharopine dehydrogenase [NAD(+), L-lysine-forming] n=2 Tax=Couchioplanes caeruleus TaxID=56438 RepID=A0A1K0GDT4_9ACTN|nr:saccharopine dehydrogenase [Couchioplanes caeruleus]OJF10310.1 saccharopine dehydrogenase [Couchioplanes caeruleus subsp. caeruleus]ROP30041.1 saccharopine dehydrogenase (NAD+, L-lysine-forming) [Couchioplanes caeruleus]